MRIRIVTTAAACIVMAIVGCSDPNRNEVEAPAKTAAPLVVTLSDGSDGFDCTTLNSTAFGSSSDVYGSGPTSLYAFINKALALATSEYNSNDGGEPSWEELAKDDLQNVKDTLDAHVSWLATNSFDATNASVSFSMINTMDTIAAGLGDAAFRATGSSTDNYAVNSGPNDSGFAALYARRAAEIAIQAAYRAQYCALKNYGHALVGVGVGSLSGLTCSDVPH